MVIVATITGGLFVDQTFAWGQSFTNLWVWALFLSLLATGSKNIRIGLVICLAIAWSGEYLLSDLWGLYDYREGHIPLFVPPGHALLYLLGVSIARTLPDKVTTIVPALLAPYVVYAIWTKLDTEVALWSVVFILFLLFGPNKKLYATMFVLALAMEIYGTSLGNWTWRAEVPFLPLTSANPPVGAGVFYCILDMLVERGMRQFKGLGGRKDGQTSQRKMPGMTNTPGIRSLDSVKS